MKKTIAIICSVVMLLTYFSGASSATTITLPKTVRVGLVTDYAKKSNIHFYNTTLRLGVYRDNQWINEVTLISTDKDFSLTPDLKYYLESDQVYKSYEEAIGLVKTLKAAGYNAFPNLISPNKWKIFIGQTATKEELDPLLTAVNGVSGLTYTKAPDSSERFTIENNGMDTIIIENRSEKTMFSTNDFRGTSPILDMGKRSYRGYIEIARYGTGTLSAVNIVDLESYLYSVVVSEISAYWPSESIKAQAVAARTFAVYYVQVSKKFPNDPYDLDDTVNSQVYKGYGVENGKINAAVDSTVNKLILYGGKVIPAYFFASSGGRTESSENVWAGTVPYLKSTPDIYETEPSRSPWLQVFTPEQIAAELAKRSINIGVVTDLIVEGYTEAGRAIDMRVVGTTGSYVLKKETMRYWLSINSRKFVIMGPTYVADTTYDVINGEGKVTTVDYKTSVVMDGSLNTSPVIGQKDQVIVMSGENIINQPMINGKAGQFTLAGEGWGHGVGMSQTGAKGMANAGFTYKEILTHYYLDTVVQ